MGDLPAALYEAGMRKLPLAPISLGLLLAACSDSDPAATLDAASDAVPPDATADAPPNDARVDAPQDAGGTTFALAFEARVGSQVFDCTKTYAGLGTTNATVEMLDFRFYVHDLRFVRADKSEVPAMLDQDGTWQLDGIALLDFEDKTGTCANGTTPTNTKIRGTVPAGSYTGVRFKLGLPLARNHADVATAPSPLNLSGLFWSWQTGYKFVRVDSRTALGDAGISVFNLHLGSTGCTGDPTDGGTTTCTNLNVPEIALDLDPKADVVVADYAAVVSGTDLKTNGGGAPGCMSGPTDPECNAVFDRLGLDLATGGTKVGQTFLKKK